VPAYHTWALTQAYICTATHTATQEELQEASHPSHFPFWWGVVE